jgi:predicted porin
MRLTGAWQAGSALSLSGMYMYTKGTNAHWNQDALQADYVFTKCTDTYIEAIYQFTPAQAAAVINSMMPSSRSSQLLLVADIRHPFGNLNKNASGLRELSARRMSVQ